jgi:hypothetical protein
VPSITRPTTSGFIQLNDIDAIYLCTEEALPPEVCPELIPEGWGLTGEVLDFQVGDEFVEAYLLRSTT